jgi:hypothetical protein
MSKNPSALPSPAQQAKSVTPCCSASPPAKCWAKTSPSSCNCWKFPTKGPESAQGRDDGTGRLRLPLAGRHGSHSDPMTAFKDTDYALLVGSRPRGPGMERAELLAINGAIFTAQGKALNAVASRDVKVLVVGNPANTNAYIAMKSAPRPAAQELHRHAASGPQPRRLADCRKDRQAVADIEKLAVWGNHSPTMYADYRFATIAGESVKAMINDQEWNKPTCSCPPWASAAQPSSKRVACLRRPRPPMPPSTTCATGPGHQRQVGHDGHSVERRIWHSQGCDVRLPCHLRKRRVQDGGRPGDRRFQPRTASTRH